MSVSLFLHGIVILEFVRSVVTLIGSQSDERLEEGATMKVEEIVDSEYIEEDKKWKKYVKNWTTLNRILEQYVKVEFGGFMSGDGELSYILKPRKHWWQKDEKIVLRFRYEIDFDEKIEFVVYDAQQLELARFLAEKLREQELSSKIIKRFEEG